MKTLNIGAQDFRDIPRNAIKGVNSIGESVTGFCKDKADSFTKTSAGEFLKKHDINKNTFIGAAILAGATYLAGKCILGIRDKVREIKK